MPVLLRSTDSVMASPLAVLASSAAGSAIALVSLLTVVAAVALPLVDGVAWLLLRRPLLGRHWFVMRPGWLAAALPLVSGFAFYSALRLSPKSQFDPTCGLLVAPLVIGMPFAFLPAAVVWRQTVRRQDSSRAVVGVTVCALVMAAATCMAAFVLWFAAGQCGE
jgi:hypothetical protein